MCLDLITKRVKPTNRTREGWRVFVSNNGQLQTLFAGENLPVNEWVRANDAGMLKFNGPGGFYAHLTKDGTDGWTDRPHVVAQVKFRRVVAYGPCFGDDAFIAEEMFIPKSVLTRVKRKVARKK
jgi:hypothetical protein